MKILAFSNVNGQIEAVRKIEKFIETEDIDCLFFLGNIVSGKERCTEWSNALKENRKPIFTKESIVASIQKEIREIKTFFDIIISFDKPLYFIPGYKDAPEERYLVEILDLVSKHSQLHFLQESIIPIKYKYIFSGFGGQLTDNFLEREFTLKFPGKYMLFSMRKIEYFPYKRILLLATPPILPGVNTNPYAHASVNDVISRSKPNIIFTYLHDTEILEIKIENTNIINVHSFENGEFIIYNLENKKIKLIKEDK